MSGTISIRFFGSDWRSDPRLRLCSPASRGVWADAISLMMEAEPYGHLAIDGRAMTPEEFGVLTCTPTKVVRTCLAELDAKGVSSKTDDGLIYSRRMLRDKAKLEAAREAGGRGGNPNLKGSGNGHDKPKPKPPDNQGGNGTLNPPDKVTRESLNPSSNLSVESDEQRSHHRPARGRQSATEAALAGIALAGSRARRDG